MSEEIYKPGQKVDLTVLRETDLGFVAKINGTHEGLLYHDEIFEQLDPGQTLPGYIKKIREDGAIDLLLQPFGNFGADELGARILEVIDDMGGTLPLNDKSPAEEVYRIFGVSKKKYKIAIGGLYKKRIIKVTDAGIELVNKKSK